jgi:hypothetical protein
MLKSIPLPVPFLIVVVMAVLLTIFFGAWAVSADQENNNFSFAVAGSGPGLGSPSLGSDTINNPDGTQQGQAGGEGAGEDDSDSWWGGAFLKACPFH